MKHGVDLELIVNHAVEMMDEQGFDQVTLAALAKRLGIRTPSLYNHIQSLQHLHETVALFGIRQLHQVMMQAAVGKAGLSAIKPMTQAYVSFARSHPGMYQAVERASAWDNAEIGQAGDAIVRLILAVLEPLQLDERNAIDAVRGLRSLVHGFASLERSSGFNLQYDKDESFAYILETYLYGLEHAPHA